MADDVIRLSQVIGVFGPGAMLDLPERSVVVGGLDKWDMRLPKAFRQIEEPRLARLLQQRLKDDPRWGEDRPPELRTPPIDPNDRHAPKPTVEAPIFPEWFICNTEPGDTPGRRRLVRFDDLLPPTRKQHQADDKVKRRASPVRFVSGCTKGHLQDIEWRRILHTNGASCRQQMWLEESGTSADPRDTRVVCDCGSALTLEQLFQDGRLGPCRGARPWIGDKDPLTCDAPRGLRLLTRSATNTYFPQVATVISLPQALDTLSRRIEENWSVLQKCDTVAKVDAACEFNPAIASALEGYTSEETFGRIVGMAAETKKADAAADPKVTEFDLFSCGRTLIGDNSPKSQLHAETLPRDRWDPTDPSFCPVSRRS